MEQRFEHEGVAFDLENGHGSVPDALNIDYVGFVAYIKPSVYLALCPPMDDEPGYVEDLVSSGRTIGIPFLVTSLADDVPTIYGHEGRHRMRGIERLVGDLPMPVAFFLKGGGRARHVEPQHLDRMAEGMLSERYDMAIAQTLVEGPIFERARLLGQEIHVGHRRPSP